jgi:hypothetical protein
MYEMTKDIEVNGHKYRLARLPASIGSWIIRILAGNGMTVEEDFYRIQNYCLKACSLLTPAGPSVIMMQDGRWAVKELEYDTEAVVKITNEMLAFNLSDFFDADGSKKAASPSASTSSLSSVPK